MESAVENEQGGSKRAGYGEAVLNDLSQQLTKDFGKGFSIASLKNFRQFYLTFPPLQKSAALRSQSQKAVSEKGSAVQSQLESGDLQSNPPLPPQLAWTHYKLLMRVENEKARTYYLNEAIAQNWSTRALERQINSFYYERILSSKKKKEVEAEAKTVTNSLAASPEDFIKDPFVLEFLNLSTNNSFLEKDLENAIIQNLQQFILELGKGYAFVAQQKHIRAGDDFLH